MSILDEYKNQKKQMIVLLLGYQGSKKSKIAKLLNEDFKFKLIKINDYYEDNKYIEKKINDKIFKIYEHVDNYDWNKLSEEVNKYKTTGVILYGNIIDIKKINFKFDFIFFTSIQNKLYAEYIIKHKLFDNIDEDYINLYTTNYITPLYDNIKKELQINKYYNIKKDTDIKKIYDELYNYLIINIKKIIQSY